MHDLPGSLRLTSTFPFVGRSAELETLRALMPMAEGEGRRVVLLGGEPGSGKSRLVREFAARGGRRRRARPLRRLRRGGAHAVRAVRRGARPPGARHRSGRAARGARHRGRRAHAAAPRSAAPRRRAAAAGQGRPGHRAPPAAHGRDRPARRRQPPAGAARARGRALGRRADAAAPAPPRAGRAATRACCCSPRSATPRPTSRRRSRRRSPTCAAPTTSSACGSAGLSGEEVSEFVRRAAGGRPRRRPAGARAGDQRPHRRQRVPRLRAVARAGRDRLVEVVDGTIRLTRPLAELGTPESVREVVSQRLSRLAPETTDAARARGHRRRGVRARHRPPGRRPRASPSCSPPSTRPSAAG